MKESRALVRPNSSVGYPKYFPEHVLLAFFMSKAETKSDLLELMLGMPSLLKNKAILTDKSTQEAFLRDSWTREDYTGSLSSDIDALIASPERLIFNVMMERYGTRPIAPILYTQGITREWKGQVYHYGDCTESTVRNLLNAIAYDSKSISFDTRIFDELESHSPELEFAPEIKDFYRRYPDATRADSYDIVLDWAVNIMTDRPGIDYYIPDPRWDPNSTPAFGISPQEGIDNFLRAMSSVMIKPEYRAEWNTKSVSARFDSICELISTPGRQFSWDIKGVQDGDFRADLDENSFANDIRFFINGEPSMEFIFYGGHWGVRDLLPSRPLALQLSSTYSEEPEAVTKLAEGLKASPTSSYLLAWLIQFNFDHSPNYLPPATEANVEFVSNLLYSFRNMDFISIFQVILLSDELVVSRLSQFVRKIIAKWPSSVRIIDNQRTIERILYKRGEPENEWVVNLAKELKLIPSTWDNVKKQRIVDPPDNEWSLNLAKELDLI
jgi:hypothetical protein